MSREAIAFTYRIVATIIFLVAAFSQNIQALALAYITLSLHDAIVSNSK